MSGKRVLVLGIVLGLTIVAPAVAADGSSLDVEVSLQPVAEPEGAYRFVAVVRDAMSGEVLSAPTLIFLRGDEAQTTSELEGGGLIRLSVSVANDGSEASYRSELVVDGEVVASQGATIRL